VINFHGTDAGTWTSKNDEVYEGSGVRIANAKGSQTALALSIIRVLKGLSTVIQDGNQWTRFFRLGDYGRRQNKDHYL
jgi:hypothetical protein